MYNEEANEAYRIYASAWLDFVDNNINHFIIRDHDIAPIKELKVQGIKPTDETVKKIYLDKAVEILKTVISSGYFSNFSEIYTEYPMIKERSEELESVIHEGIA